MYRLMIVDDEKAIRERLPLAFNWSEYGFEVVGSAANGQEALEKVPELKPDLILLDIQMPILDGLGFLKELSRSPYRNVFVIILTGYSEFDYAVTAMRYGARGYLTKPLDDDEIADLLMDIVQDLKTDEAEPAAPNALSANVATYIDQHYMEPLTVSGIAQQMFVDASNLGQVFRRDKGMTVRQYLNQVRIGEAKRLLEQTTLRIYEIAQRVGFSESKYFVVCFEQATGLSPLEYRKQKTGGGAE